MTGEGRTLRSGVGGGRCTCSSCVAALSGAAFAIVFERECQQVFLAAHVEAFAWFSAVFARVRYDSLAAAVNRVLRRRRRVETDRFVALWSHYLFRGRICPPRAGGRE
jgi:transposase